MNNINFQINNKNINNHCNKKKLIKKCHNLSFENK